MSISIHDSHFARKAVVLLLGLGGYLLLAESDFLPKKGSETSASVRAGPEGAPTHAETRKSGLSESDRVFLEKAGRRGRQDEEISRGLVGGLVYPEVREYAYGLIDFSVAENAELKTLAASKGVTIPAPEEISYRQWCRDDSIDEHYIELLTRETEGVVGLFEKATESDDAEIAGFARKTLPAMQRHLQATRDLQKVIK